MVLSWAWGSGSQSTPAAAEAAPSTQAQRQVLQSPELLESILLQLDDLSTLLLAQGVCSHWQDMILHSPRIQEHLFFRPSPLPPKGATAEGQDTNCIPRRRNELLAKHFPQWFPDPGVENIKALKMNDFESLPLMDRQLADKYRRAEASWRRMLPCQPPIRTLCRVEYTTTRGTFLHADKIIPRVERSFCETAPWKMQYAHEMFPQDEYAKEEDEVFREPMSMGAIYKAVVELDNGFTRRWLFVWKNLGGPSLPEYTPRDNWKIAGDLLAYLEQELNKNGLVLFLFSRAPACGLGLRNWPRNYFDRRYKLLSWVEADNGDGCAAEIDNASDYEEGDDGNGDARYHGMTSTAVAAPDVLIWDDREYLPLISCKEAEFDPQTGDKRPPLRYR